MNINFIIPDLNSTYGNVICSMIDPIRLFLTDSIVSQKSYPDCINVHFFVEQVYLDLVDFQPGQGINVFMDHGMSDKCYKDADKVNAYDYVCVTGPLWKQKMIVQGLPKTKLLTIGFAKLDRIFNEGLAKKKTGKSEINLLWAPTHSNSVSSYPVFESYLDKFPSSYLIRSSIHPFHKTDWLPTFKEMIETDVVISDTSSIIYEAWAIGKPVVFPDWLVKNEVAQKYPDSFEDVIFRENIGYHAQSFGELVQLVRSAAMYGLDQRTKEFMEGILPSAIRGNSGQETAKVLRELQNECNVRWKQEFANG